MPEVYSFVNSFTALFILILIAVVQKNTDDNFGTNFKIVWVLSFLFGLSLGAHSIEILYLPFLFILIYWYYLRPNRLPVIKNISILFFFFLLGFSIYLYLPIRASQQPYFNWGDPQTLSQFLIHVTDRKDASVHLSVPSPTNVLLPQIINYLKFFPDNFSYPGTFFGLVGGIYLLLKQRRFSIVLAVFFLPPFVFFIRFWGDSSNYLSGFLIFSIFLGVGIWVGYISILNLIRRFQFNPKVASLFLIGVGINFLILLNGHFQKNDKSNYWIPEKPFKSVLLDVDNHGIIFARSSHFSFSFLQEVAYLRPDVTHISSIEFLSPKLFFNVSPERYPMLTIPEKETEKIGSAFLSANIENHPIYWEPDPENDYLVSPYLSLNGPFYRVLASPPPITELSLNSYRDKLKDFFDPRILSENNDEHLFYGDAFLKLGKYLLEQGQYELALQHLEISDMLQPDNIYSLNLLGVAHAQLKQMDKAEQYLVRTLEISPEHLEAQRNLGVLYITDSKYEKAETALLKAERLQNKDAATSFQLGLLYRHMGDDQKAKAYFEKTLKEDPENQEATQALDLFLQPPVGG